MAQENREAQRNKELHEQQLQSHMRVIIEQITSINERFGKLELEIKEVKAQTFSNKEASTSNAKRDSNPKEEGPYCQHTDGSQEQGEFEFEEEINDLDRPFDRRLGPRQFQRREQHHRPNRREFQQGYLQQEYPPQGRGEGQIGSLRPKLPEFEGKADPEEYLNWEQKVDFLFDCYEYSEEKKYKLAVSCFTEYAMSWWVSEIADRRRTGEPLVTRWTNLKPILRKRFVPSYFFREQLRKVHSLRQGSMTVEEYAREMKLTMLKANLVEDEETTMSRFLNGLNREIADAVDMHHYLEFNELLMRACKVERSLKGRSKAPISTSSTSWRKANNEQGKKIPFKPK